MYAPLLITVWWKMNKILVQVKHVYAIRVDSALCIAVLILIFFWLCNVLMQPFWTYHHVNRIFYNNHNNNNNVLYAFIIITVQSVLQCFDTVGWMIWPVSNLSPIWHMMCLVGHYVELRDSIMLIRTCLKMYEKFTCDFHFQISDL